MPPRLVLYSDQIRGRSDAVDEALLALLGDRERVGFVPAASDPRRRYFNRACEHYLWLGLPEPEEYDIEAGCTPERLVRLWESDAIHLGSGDPLHFAAFLAARGALRPLRDFAARGGLLIGVSAGAMLFGDVVIDPLVEMSKGAKPQRPLKGLGLFSPLFYPHFDGDEKTGAVLARFARVQKRMVLACHDSEGVVVDGKDVRLIGDVTSFAP